mmetsp:Transcript_112155/g.177300  ORF Transcript_112155/g.177300 Transcript_112155/m.177300 type:complete len:193 (-) Transcript_112155:20-598(-)
MGCASSYPPLIDATRREDLKAVQKLLNGKQEIDVNLTDHEGCTALWHACNVGNRSIAETLLAVENIDVNIRDKVGRTPLMMAIHGSGQTNDWEKPEVFETIAETLMRRDDIDVTSKTYDTSMTPMLFAAKEGRTHVVRHLLTKEGVDVNDTSKDFEGRPSRRLSALAWAKKEKHTDVVKHLLLAGAKQQVEL